MNFYKDETMIESKSTKMQNRNLGVNLGLNKSGKRNKHSFDINSIEKSDFMSFNIQLRTFPHIIRGRKHTA